MGQERLDRTKQSTSKPVVIDQGIKLKQIEKRTKGVKYKCSCCGEEYTSQKNSFPVSNSILYAGNNGYLTICKKCVEKYYNQLVGIYSGNEEHALRHCCALFDWYYGDEVAAMTKNVSRGYSRVSSYPSKMNLAQVKGKTFLDTVRLENTSAILKPNDISEQPEDMQQVSQEEIARFGFGYSPEEYMYLSEQYKDWTTRYECKSKAMEELIKSLCIAQLTIQRVQRRGASMREIKDAMETFQGLLGTANLKPNAKNENALAEQNTFGTLIKKWENEDPICTPDEEWEDVDGIKKLIDTYFLGHLCNLVHVKNDNEEAYRKAMEANTVLPPTYEEDDDLGETSLLDKYSDKGDKSNGGTDG